MSTKLYYHRTDGGAEYLTDAYVETDTGHREGIFEGAAYIVRLDGGPELVASPAPDLLATLETLVASLDEGASNDDLYTYVATQCRDIVAIAKGGV